MKFIRVEDGQSGAQALTQRLSKELKKGQRVLWLVCGGSSIPLAAEIMKNLKHEDTKDLAIFLTDERYGEFNHLDSNAKQLHDAGFATKDAIFVPVLVPGFSLEETDERYEQALKAAVEHAGVVIAMFGIGADGHIAGILPHSPAVEAEGWVVGYDAGQFTRVTLTFQAIRRIMAAYAFVFGDSKHDALQHLRDEDLPLGEQPSQILKELPEAYIYNDQIGDKK